MCAIVVYLAVTIHHVIIDLYIVLLNSNYFVILMLMRPNNSEIKFN